MGGFFSSQFTLKLHELVGPGRHLPVQVKGRNLRIVSFKVREVEEIYVRLCVSGLSVNRDTQVLCAFKQCLDVIWHNRTGSTESPSAFGYLNQGHK